MAKKKNSDSLEKAKFWKDMPEETTQAILAIFTFLVTLLSLLAAFGKAGPIGDYGYAMLVHMFGWGYFLIPIIATLVGIALLQGIEKRFKLSKSIGALVLFLSGLGLIHIAYYNGGGIIGRWIAGPLIKIMDVWASGIILGALVIVSIFILFEVKITLEDLMFWKGWKKTPQEAGQKKAAGIGASEEAFVQQAMAKANSGISALEQEAAAKAAAEQKRKLEEKRPAKANPLAFTEDEEKTFASPIVVPLMKPFTAPPLSLLEKDKGKPETGDIKANANIIKRTLQNFNITVEMDEISIGPSVTRYALKPAEGVKLARIVGLNNDLSLALAAHPIRIEAPIPGKSLVGIEVPNTAKTMVGLATLLAAADYQDSDKPLLVSLGKDITGRAHFANLAKAPHVLIAGATGSGKSVTIHTLVTSLLYRNSPENLKFIMIDPKRVELTLYNKIPHLLTPVITDPKKAILALKWAGKEMSRRYDILEQSSVRDIDSYHKTVLAPAVAAWKKAGAKTDDATVKLPETMPYIVVIIDELADIMQTYPRELESAIVRLAQMSRAVGIHLMISTQRPSVNVITGLIKANVPTRIALQVASQIDSRTILDQPGGDTLYLGGEMSKPVRLQAAYVSENEVKRVVKYLTDAYRDEVVSEINMTPTEAGATAAFDAMMDGDGEEEDDLYETAREAVTSAGKASTSYIQRKLGVGYSRAAKLMDMLEQHGVIGPANGSKAREIMGGSAGMEQQATAMIEEAGGDPMTE